MSRINLSEISYVAYQASDLELMERFLTDFGMTRSALNNEGLFMRGSGPAHHIHVTRLGNQAKFLGVAFGVNSRDELIKAATEFGATEITAITDPGGGERVAMTSPTGHTIWLEYGREELAHQETRASYQYNFYGDTRRRNASIRQTKEISPVQSIGHVVLRTDDVATEVNWFMSNFSLIQSDFVQRPGDEGPEIFGTFIRFDKGEEFVEHHCILVTESSHEGCHHSSFQVVDFDALIGGNEYLAEQGWEHFAGIGRHYLGSYVFDYWFDPFGNRIEHYTDTDILNEEHEPTYFQGKPQDTTQWGMPPPTTFFE